MEDNKIDVYLNGEIHDRFYYFLDFESYQLDLKSYLKAVDFIVEIADIISALRMCFEKDKNYNFKGIKGELKYD